MNKKMIFKIGGLLLCVFFFVLPLVQCSQDSSIKATGFQIASGTGELMKEAEKSYPVAFVILIIPIVLVIVAFKDKSFAVIRNVSIAGLAIKIIFMIVANSMLSKGDLGGAFVLTPFNWFVMVIYAGLVGFAQYCIKQENVDSAPPINKTE